jgi:Fur family transcriptional regulator, ferric uptake regulator
MAAQLDVVQQLEDRLERAGHRVTPPRRAVLQSIARRPDQFTPDDIVEDARPAGRATVFRTMRLLQDEGAICRVVMNDGTPRYRVDAVGHHHHFVCLACGDVKNITGCDVPAALRSVAAAQGFEVQGHSLELYGRCASCSRRKLPEPL